MQSPSRRLQLALNVSDLEQAVRFYTETKTVTSRWFSSEATSSEANFSIQLR